MPEVAVRLTAVTKRLGRVIAVDRLSLDVQRGEFVCLLGPSGCGKTTTLRLIAGFIQPDEGMIEIMGQDMANRPPYKRNIGMVFQNYALFPHMTVFENVAFGLKMRNVPKAQIKERVEQVLDLVQLSGMSQRYPRQLSGGQQQRVALARAIVIQPDVLLLDEPLSNLDAKLRESMQRELRELQQRLAITTIYVTHDQEEAMTMSDRIAVMAHGHIVQVGSPAEIYRRPSNRFVASFIGKANLVRGRLERLRGGWCFSVYCGIRIPLPEAAVGSGVSGDAELVIRPEALRILPSNIESTSGLLIPARIVNIVYTGPVTDYEVEVCGGERLLVEQQNDIGLPQWQVGESVNVAMILESIYVIPVEAGMCS
jgi:spermidine/putrescine ABC transporter ATP-binding subunit